MANSTPLHQRLTLRLAGWASQAEHTSNRSQAKKRAKRPLATPDLTRRVSHMTPDFPGPYEIGGIPVLDVPLALAATTFQEQRVTPAFSPPVSSIWHRAMSALAVRHNEVRPRRLPQIPAIFQRWRIGGRQMRGEAHGNPQGLPLGRRFVIAPVRELALPLGLRLSRLPIVMSRSPVPSPSLVETRRASGYSIFIVTAYTNQGSFTSTFPLDSWLDNC